MTESEISYLIRKYLKANNVFHWRHNNVGVFKKVASAHIFHDMKNVSDILGILPNGIFFAIEVKTEVGKVSLDQKKFIDQVNNLGGLAFVARSLKDVEQKLEGILNGKN